MALCRSSLFTLPIGIILASMRSMDSRPTTINLAYAKLPQLAVFIALWAKFPGKMHLQGHQFTGPATRLYLRQNPDITPKNRSKPIIPRVDYTVYQHDAAICMHCIQMQRINTLLISTIQMS